MTQCERILEVLRDGRPHTAADLYRTGCVLHSRISDLRKRGYNIELSRIDGVGADSYLYQLTTATPDGAPAAGVPSGAVIASVADGINTAVPTAPSTQLVLV